MANYMEKIAQMLGIDLEEEFDIDCSHVPYKITKDGIFYWSEEQYGWQSIDSWLTEILSGKIKIIKKPILDEVEKEYLSAVVKPFRDMVKSVIKYESGIYEYIVIRYRSIEEHIGTVHFPPFKKGTMYKGMEIGKAYSLNELGV